MTNLIFEPPFWEVRGYVCTLSVARWKARNWLSIGCNWTFFSSSYGLDVISRYWSKSAFVNRRLVTLSANFRWKRTSPTNLFWYQKTRLITLSCGVDILSVCSLVSSQSTRVMDRRTDRRTDGETDGQNYDPQGHASISASRGKNQTIGCSNIAYCLMRYFILSHPVYTVRQGNGSTTTLLLEVYTQKTL